MTDATLITDRERPRVRLERELPDPPEVAWAALAAAFEPELGPQEGPPAGYKGDDV